METMNRILENMKYDELLNYARKINCTKGDQKDRDTLIDCIMYRWESIRFTSSYRMITYDAIFNTLLRIKREEGASICLDDEGKYSLSSYVKDKGFIGAGGFGSVRLLNMPIIVNKNVIDISMVIKITSMSQNVYKQLLRGWEVTENPFEIPDIGMKEVIIHYFINILISRNINPNFVMMYKWYVCKKCKVMFKRESKKLVELDPGPCIITLLERYNTDCLKFFLINRNELNEKHTEKEITRICKVFVFQILLALATLQRYYGMDHADTSIRNVFVRETETVFKTHLEYTFNKETYYIPNTGYFFSLADYGISRTDRIFGVDGGEKLVALGDVIIKRIHERGNKYHYYPEVVKKEDLSPFHHPERFHMSNRGFVMFVDNLRYIKTKYIQKIVYPYLNKIIYDATSKDSNKLKEEKKFKFGRVNYDKIIQDLFSEFKTKPKKSEVLDKFNMDKSIDDIDIDNYYLRLLRRMYNP